MALIFIGYKETYVNVFIFATLENLYFKEVCGYKKLWYIHKVCKSVQNACLLSTIQMIHILYENEVIVVSHNEYYSDRTNMVKKKYRSYKYAGYILLRKKE